MISIGKHLLVGKLPRGRGRKTDRWQVFNKRSPNVAGVIKWYLPWRQYIFTPGWATIFSAGCLNDIAHFIKQEMANRGK